MDLSNKNNNVKNPNNSFNNCNTKANQFFKTDNNEEINDNVSEKANSVQTSYKYHKNKKGPNSTSSKDQQENYLQNEYDTSIEMSENENLICPNCINCTLMEEKRI